MGDIPLSASQKLTTAIGMSLLSKRTSPYLQYRFLRPSQSALSTSRLAAKPYSSKHPQHGKDQEPPQMPKFSLDGLGATPAMKAVIYTAIGIMATAETYTYGLWIYHKLYPEQAVQSRRDGETGEQRN